MLRARLGVNIDHVATLRQARGEHYPSLVDATVASLEAGADQITIHLREDRRHIQDTDVGAIKLVTSRYGKPLNLELGCAEDILGIAEEIAPDWLCIVPEKRQEKTTEGGLDLITKENTDKIQWTIERIRKRLPNSKISLFVEADPQVLSKCIEFKVDAVEIHTGDYAKAFLNGEDLAKYFTRYATAKKQIKAHNIGFHAGHGLTDESVAPLVERELFEEYNIGHWIVCQAIFDGLGNVVTKLKRTILGDRQ